MSYKWPKPTYVAFPVAGVLPFVPHMLEHWAEHQEWWKCLPFGWISLVILAFGIGAFVQDLANDKSSLRYNWREWRKVFSVLTAHAAHLDNPERVDILCHLKFIKDFRGKLIVRVIVPLADREPDIKVVHQEQIDIPKDGEKRLRLGSISITKPGDAFARHSLWGEILGEKDLKGHAIYASRNIIEIVAGPQTFRIYAHVLDTVRKEHERIYLLRENELPEFYN